MYYYKQAKDGIIVSVEAKSKPALSPNFVKATKAEYDAFNASLPVVEPEPPLSFVPLNPTQGVEHRLSHVEAFLSSQYPQ